MTASAEADQRQRQRKFHRRSRKGCTVCKLKHLRCDEVRPFCTYCVKHGAVCKYPPGHQDGQVRNRPRGSRNSAAALAKLEKESAQLQRHQPVISMLDVTPKDPLIGTSYHLSETSRSLFELFARTRVLYSTRVERTNSFIVFRALADPGFQHAALLLTALQWVWETGDATRFAVPYLHHKLQAIRYVNEQLASPTKANDGTIAAVSSLAIIENAMGSPSAVACHLQGLARMTEVHRHQQQTPRKRLGLLPRLVLMATRSVARRPVWDILDISRTDYVHQSVIISLLRVAIRPIYSVFLLSGSSTTTEEPLSEVMARAPHSFAPASDGSGGASSEAGAASPPSSRSTDASRSGFLACFFYLYVILREDSADAFLLTWFLEQLLADVCRTEEPMQKGDYSSSVWFWTVVFGGCVASSARTSSTDSDCMEAREMRAIRDTYLDKINMASRFLGVHSWEGARAVLHWFAWEEDFDGEVEVRALWEEAMGRGGYGDVRRCSGGCRDESVEPGILKSSLIC